MKVLEIAVGAVFVPTRFSLVRISSRDFVADGKSLVRNSGVGGGGQNLILKISRAENVGSSGVAFIPLSLRPRALKLQGLQRKGFSFCMDAADLKTLSSERTREASTGKHWRLSELTLRSEVTGYPLNF